MFAHALVRTRPGSVRAVPAMLSALLLAAAGPAHAQLSGAYTIGAGGDYATFAAATTALQVQGVSGPVTFSVLPGLYSEQLVVLDAPGSSVTNRVTFQSALDDPLTVILQWSPPTGSEPTVELNGASWVTLRKLTIVGTTDVGPTSAVRISGTAEGTVLSGCVLRTSTFTSGEAVTIESGTSQTDLEISDCVLGPAGYGLLSTETQFLDCRILRNRFLSTMGLILDDWQGGAGALLIANNFFPNSQVAIYPGPSSDGLQFVFNSIFRDVTGDGLVISGSGPNGLAVVKNNIIRAEGAGYAYLVSDTAMIAESDYNDLSAGGGAVLANWAGTNCTTLSALQAAGGKEANSISVPPSFAGATDLHTATAALDGAGSPIAGVAEDIDGELRNPVTPDIGADEFTAVAGLAGTYTVGAGGDYATFAAATADLESKGVSGPVTFDVLSGTYAGQVNLAPVPGASPANRVTFRSQSGNAADVTLQFDPVSSAQGVIEIADADYLTISTLTLQVTQGSGNGSGLTLQGVTQGVRIEGCVINGLASSGTGVRVSSGAHDSLVIRQNTIPVGANGIALFAATYTGVRVERNLIGTLGQWAIELAGWTGPLTGAVRIANNVVQNGGILIQQGAGTSRGVEILHNSVSRAAAAPVLSVSTLYGMSPNAVSILNNVFSNIGDGVVLNVGDPAAIAASDHNSLHTTGATLASWGGSDHGSLAELRSASGRDLASIEGFPGFIDELLHTRSSFLNAAAQPLANVTEDFDGDPRDPATPDIGADEFATPYTPLAGTYSVGAGAQYNDLASAAVDLQLRGVSGPVTFELISQTFPEQLEFYSPIGVSATNRVTFRSQTGDAADVTVTFDPGNTAEGVVHLNGADHVTLSDLTLQVGGIGLGSGVAIAGATVAVRVQRCVITGMLSGYGVLFPYGSRADSTEVSGNTIAASSRGVTGNVVTLTGVRIMGNTIRDAASAGISLPSWTGPASGAVRIANNMMSNADIELGLGGASLGLECWNNTVYMSGLSDALSLSSAVPLPGTIQIQNNILACVGGGRPLVSNQAIPPGSCDHNDLYTTGWVLTSVGPNASQTLAEHRAANSIDLNSVSFHPGVVSATDLHTTLTALDGRGTPVASVVTDFDGQPRDPSTPDIGADEFAPGSPLATGTYTIGAGGDYATFSAATSDLLLRGVSGPVTFAALTGTYTEQVIVRTAGGMSSANRVTFESQSGSRSDVTVQYSTPSYTPGVFELQGASWTTVRNLTLRITTVGGGGSGVRLSGFVESAAIQGCAMTGLQASGYGVNLASGRADSLRVTDNLVDSGARGINLETVTLRGVQVLRNSFMNGGTSSVYVRGWDGPAGGAMLIANNWMSAPLELRTSGPGSVGVEAYHNSISITSASYTAFSLSVASGTAPANAVRLKNNVFASFAGGRALQVPSSSTLAECDYNDYFTPGTTLAAAGAVNHADLSAWQAASGFDTHSIAVHPGFADVSDDLHTASSFLDGLGTPVAGVTEDFDGQIRSGSAPDIGADEFIAVAPIATGAYTVGAGGDYQTPTAMLDDLYQRGVAGPVTFQLLTGTYTGQWKLQTPAGASAANRVTFRSQTGNAADVSLQYPSPGLTTGIVEFRGADHVSIADLTLRNNGPVTSACGVFVSGRSTSSTIEGCTFASLGSGGVGINIAGGAAAESLLVHRSTVTGVGFGLLGGAGITLTGVRVLRNWFGITVSTGSPISVQNWTGPASGSLFIANNFLTGNGRVSLFQGSSSAGLEFSFNSVNVTNGSGAVSLGESGGAPPAGSVRLLNNIFQNRNATGPALTVSNGSVVAESDHNDFHKPSGGTLANWGGTAVSTLAALQAASGKDAQSVSGDPLFVSLTDLHTSANLLAGAGTPVAGIADDFDGQPRDPATPDIGADEYTPSGPPLAGTYTIGAGGSYLSFAAAVGDLASRGVSAPVTFDVLPGIYNEQVTLNSVPGASPASRVTFRSQTGNAADATLRFANNLNSSGVLQLSGVSHVTFRDLTIAMSGGGGTAGAAVYLTNSVGAVWITNCVLAGSSLSGRGLLAAGATLDSVLIEGNRFPLTGESMNLSGNLTGAQILGNVLEGVSNATTGGLIVNGWNGPASGSLLIANNFCRGNAWINIVQSPGSNGLEIYHNSVRTSGALDACVLTINISAPAGSARIEDNVFACAGNGRPLVVALPSVIAVSDYNDLYTAGGPVLTRWGGSNYATLAAHQAATGQDAHSVSGDPQFTSASDLHSSAPLLDGAGTPLAAVPADIDGEPRSLTAPDIGADEFALAAPLAGDYTVGTAGDYATPAAAAADLTLRGVSGQVNFLIQSGTYDGTVTLTTIAGAGPGARVRFASQSGAAGDVVLRASAANSDGSDAVLRLAGARYVDVEAVTLRSTVPGASGTLAWLASATDNDRFLGCTLDLALGGLYGIYGFSAVMDSLVVRNCTFSMPSGSSYGYGVSAAGFSTAHGAVIEGNDFTGGLTGIYWVPSLASNGMIVRDNTCTMGSSGTGFLLSFLNGGEVTGNRIASDGYGMNLQYMDGSTLVANNFVQAGGYGFFLQSPASIRLYHNSVNHTGASGSAVHVSPSALGAVTLVDNVLAATGGGYALSVNGPPSHIALSNYNDLYVTGPALARFNFTDYPTLADLRAGTGFEAQSVSANPSFVSATDLHAQAAALDGTGTPLAEVTTDIDGEPRSLTAPDIGADEFAILDGIPPVVTFEAGPADNAVLFGDTASYAWSATDNLTPGDSITYRSALDGPFSGAYGYETSRSLAGLTDGPHTFRVEARDLAGGISAPIARTLRVHRTAPDVAFDSPAAGAFTGGGVGVTWHLIARSLVSNPDSIFFSSRLDSGAFSAPARDSSLALSGLAEGPHSVEVRVTDEAGLANTRSRAFTVDLTAPTVSIASGPPEGGYSPAGVAFTFSSTDNLTPAVQMRYSYRLDGGAFTPPSTTAGANYADLGPGPHTFGVRAHDAADNVSAEVVRQWTVDLSPPETQIAGGPADGDTLGSNSVTFDFTGTDNLTPLASLRFQARLDGAAFDAISTATSRGYAGLPDGPHAFQARAVDLAGLADGTPAARTFTVDAQGPAILIASGPANNACVDTADVAYAWSATDAVTPQGQIEFSYQLDATPFTAYGPDTSASFTSLAEGLHTFTLQARDGSGHVTSVTRSFRVDVSAPVAAAPTTRVLDSSRIRIQCTASDNSGVTGFRVQVSTDPAFGSLAADVQIGASGTHDFIGVPGSSYYARSQASDCAGNLTAFTGPSNVAILASLPNLVVTNVTAPPTATSGQPIVVDYTVANNGAGPTSTPSWWESVWLSPTPTYDAQTAVLLGQRQNVTFLGVGESYTGSVTGTVPLGTSGTRYVLATADGGDAVPETDGTDNTSASGAVAVALGAVADLVVTQVVAPPTALSGETVTVSWTVRNDGAGRTDASQWYDAVFLSTDATFDFDVLGGQSIRATDDWLARTQHTGVLEADSSYTASLQVTLPPYFGGTRYLIVASDMNASTDNQSVGERGLVFEDQQEINATAGAATEVTQQLPPDLRVDALTTNGQPVSGGGLQASFTVGNHGFNATGAGAWTDQLWLSADSLLDVADVLLGSYPQSGNLDLDASYSRNVVVNLPKGISGPRWLIAKLDVYGQLVEYLESNNVTPLAQPVNVALSPWPNLAPVAVSVSDTVLAGGSGTAQWQVSNAGTGSVAAAFTDNVELGTGAIWTSSARVSGSQRANHVLQPAESYSASATFNVPASYAGTYWVFARTDAQNEVFEHTDEGDNIVAIGTVYVKPYPAIDLGVTNVSGPAAASGGGPLPVSYSVANGGQGATLAGWWPEEVWLSSDTSFNPAQDHQVATPGHAGALAAGAGYARDVSGTVPQGLNGAYHVIVRSDPGGASGDGALANNTAVSAGTVLVTSPAPPQLTVSGVTVAANLDAGQPALVGWQVNNGGAGAVPNSEWYVGAYLSQDPWLDGSDVSLGSVAGPAALGGGSSAPQQLTATMPGWASGAYYVIVRADNRGEVWEAGAENDNAATAPTTLTLPPPSDLVVTDVLVPPAAVPGEPITVTYTLANQGANPAVGQLQNAVFMSSDSAFISSVDPLVGVEIVNINLPPGGSQRFTARASARPLQVDLDGNVTGTLPPLSPGSYHAIVRANIRDNIRESDGANNQTISAAQVLTDLPALSLGIPAAFDLADGQARFWKVSVPADFDLELTLSSDVADATNEMFTAFARTPDENEWDFSGPAGFTANPVVLVPQTQAGTYYLMVVARDLGQVAGLEHLTLLAETLPFSITSHAPTAGGAGGRVTMRVRGAGLRDTTEFRLEQSGVVKARARLAKFTNSTDVLARFDLTGVAEGLYDLVAANGLTTVVIPGGFSVEPARPVEVAIETDNADVLRRSATAPFTVRLRNPSNQDAPVVRARVLFPATSALRSLEADPGLFPASALVPSLTPVAGDAAVLHRAGGGDSLLAVEVVGANLAPGESRALTLGVSGFDSSPYSIRVLADATTVIAFLDRQQAAHEAARRALLSDPAGLPADLVALAGDAFAFRDTSLINTYVRPGMLAASDVEDYLFIIDHLVLPSPDFALPAGPQTLLDELAAGGPCGGAGVVPECAPDVAVPGTALPACVSVFDAADLPVPVAVADGRVARVAGGSAAGFAVTASANARVVVPCDPNLMTGPAGFGTEKWVRGAAPMPYRVDFENLPGVASAPAQVVRITVPIDPNLDLTTFRVGSMGFGGTHQINVPGGRTSYSAQNGYADLGLAVRVTAGINLQTREASWVFTTIDPATGQQPTNPYIGFLPVNNQFGDGTGFVTYSIQPYANAVSGGTVQAQASIQFDVNTPMPTNMAMNRVDTRLPSSAALTGIEQLDASRVRVHWTGSDDSTGAGLANVTLYVRQDVGAFTPVAPPTSGTSLEVPVADGHTFGFYTLAADNVGNAEVTKSDPEAAVTVGSPQLGTDNGPPRVTLLYQNFPNPFRAGTRVRFDLARDETVTLDIFDVQGRLVSQPLDAKRLEAGSHVVDITRLPRGASVYFYRLRAGDYEKTRRMVLIP